MRFVDGKVYRLGEIRQHTFVAEGSAENLPEDTPMRYSRKPGSMHGEFVQVVTPQDPLVPSTSAQIAVESLRDHGLTFRQIARTAGLSIEVVHRAASGIGRIRQSSESALVGVAASLNGKAPPSHAQREAESRGREMNKCG